MPQYILPEMEAPEFKELDAFTQGYIQAMFFTNTSCIPMTDWHLPESKELVAEGQADGDLPNDVGFLDLHPDALDDIAVDCVTFQIENAKALAAAYEKDGYDEEQAGMDFWHTRNGHGVGYWDRGLGDVGDALSEAARKAGERNPWFSDEPDESSPTGYGYVYHGF